MKTLLKFIFLCIAMYVLTFIPFGIYINAAISLYALWTLAKSI